MNLELLLPDYLASALINGDLSSFSLDEDGGTEAEAQIEAIGDYVEAQGYWRDPVSVADDGSFYRRPPFDAVNAYGATLGGTFVTYTFLPKPQTNETNQ